MRSILVKKLNIPDKPGVYFFKKGKDILYIGKATSLKDRVKSYFGKDLIQTRGPIVLDMVFKADKIKWQETDSVLEALILEANLIKKYQPKYNTKEKSDKSFNYVYITKPARNASHGDAGGEELPRVLVIRGRNLLQKQEDFSRVTHPNKGGTLATRNLTVSFVNVFGPYPNSSQLKEALRIIRRIFPFIDATSGQRNNQEFYRQIYLNPQNLEGYLRDIKYIKLFLQGKKKNILRELKKKMFALAKLREFEQADKIKRQIFALQHINDVALIKNDFAGDKIFDPAPFFGRIKRNKAGPSDTKILSPVSSFRIEAYDIAHLSGKNMVGVMTVVENGEVEKSEYKKFKIRTQTDANDTGALKEVLERRLNHSEWPYPGLIVVDGGIAQINTAKAVLAKMGLKINVVSVLKDERHKPKAILFPPRSDLKGAQGPTLVKKYKREILLVNSEAHRFAIAYHKNMRNKNFLK